MVSVNDGTWSLEKADMTVENEVIENKTYEVTLEQQQPDVFDYADLALKALLVVAAFLIAVRL